MKYLKRIQSKPSSVKARYAFLIALSCTIIIAFIWSTTLPARFSHIDGTQDVEKTEPEPTNTLTDIFNEAKVQVGNVVNWDEGEPESFTTTNLDALSKPKNRVATTSPVTESDSIEERQSTTTSPAPVPEAPRTVLIEVREKESTEEPESEGQSAEGDTNTQTP